MSSIIKLTLPKISGSLLHKKPKLIKASNKLPQRKNTPILNQKQKKKGIFGRYLHPLLLLVQIPAVAPQQNIYKNINKGSDINECLF
ncbi:hypothetical protein KEJ37_03575 [Candidatus Bathyarchaeota archaeon]|nr:hypothetical protein [Candidatus Bathyarchaeota archaeon]